NEAVTETYNSSDRTDTTRSINARLGLDYQLNKSTVIGALLSGNERKYTQSELKESATFKNQIRDTVTRFSNSESNRWKNYSINFNIQHRFKKNEELVLNFDYIHYSNDQPVNYFASYYDGSENFLYDEATRSGKSTLFIFKVGALDYSASISNNVKMQTGIKETIGGFENDISFEKYHQNNWAKEPNLSADYTLNENYSAAYISFNVTVSKSTDAKLGARYEYTNSNLGTALVKNIVDRHYGNLFPTLFLSHLINENNKISFSYSMRINRPKFTDLAPFTYFSDPKTVITGNPELQPSISNTVKGDYTFKKYLFSLSYSKEDDAITGFQPETDSVTNKVVVTPKNLINKKTVFVSLSTPVTVNTWWSMQYNISGLWQQTNLFYKKERLQFSQINYRINAIESFKLPKQWSAELSGFYQSPLLLGITTSRALGSLDLGIKKKLNGNHGSFLISANNILNTQRRGFHVNLPAQNLVSDGNARFIWPSYKLTYTHNFGKEKLKVKRERVTGAEEEKGRVN
ncbi:MAG: outer membrane beta-barrel family protein, partial [Ferruginibacter sp.]